MAIKRSLEKFIFGQTIILNNTYNQVTHVTLNKTQVDCVLSVYTDDTKSELIQTEAFTFMPNVETNALEILTQCYEYVKTQEGFENAIDV